MGSIDKKRGSTREEIQARLDELKRQLEAGQAEIQQLQARGNYLRETMLRIGGAIQVLEELLTLPPLTEIEGASNTAEGLVRKDAGVVGA